MPFGVMQSLKVKIFQNDDEATKEGYAYTAPTKGVEIKEVVVVRDGTESGNSTVDFLMEDQDGNKYVVMLTGRLLKSIPC